MYFEKQSTFKTFNYEKTSINFSLQFDFYTAILQRVSRSESGYLWTSSYGNYLFSTHQVYENRMAHKIRAANSIIFILAWDSYFRAVLPDFFF